MQTFKFQWILLLTVSLSALAWAAPTPVQVPMTEEVWSVNAEDYKFEEYLGSPSLYLPQGFAELADVQFHNGTIEFDIAFPEGRGFPGIIFRMQDNRNYEEVYFRPHQSNNPDANQYTPVFNGLAGWQLYHGDGHGAPVLYRYDAWNHVKLVIKGTRGEVYINDMDQPVFQIHDLKHGDVAGPLVLKGHAQSHFANFSYTLTDEPVLKLPIAEIPPLDSLAVGRYEVSNALPDELLADPGSLDVSSIAGVQWTAATPEYTGTVNVARIASRSDDHNWAMVRITIDSDRDQIKRMDFGYSDDVCAYVNGKIIYGGQRRFRSRDYRYLGTIGYFDSLYLDLNKGSNEIVLAVIEGFGGWGVRARLADLDGINIR